MIENVNLWFAKDMNDNIITIDKINEANKHNTYTCPICGSEVIAKLGDIKVHHFAHRDKSKCSSETMIHWWVKNKLLEIGDSFSIKLNKEDVRKYICKDIIIEKEYMTEFGKYKPDVTLVTTNDEIIYIEIDCTNKKKCEEYLDRWLCLNNTVVEVSVKDMINSNVEYLKTLFCEGKCYNLKSFETQYHNTIGTYKQKIFTNDEVGRAKERLGKINWFWEECKKYRMHKTDDGTFFDVIDCLDVKDKEYVIDGLLKSNCTAVRKLYLFNKQKEVVKSINEFCKENNISISVETGETTRYSNTFQKRFRVPYVRCFSTNFYMDIYDDVDIMRYLNNVVCSRSINEKIEQIKLPYNYGVHLYRSDYRGAEIRFNYDEYYLFTSLIDDIKNKDIDQFIYSELDKYRGALVITGFENDIWLYLNEKQDKIKKLSHIKSKNDIYLVIDRETENTFTARLLNTKEYMVINGNKIINVNEEETPFDSLNDFKIKMDKILSGNIRRLRYGII